MNYIIFGGSGFIGTHLIHLLRQECVRPGDKIYDLDLVMPGEEGVVPGIVEKNEGVEYIRADVRQPLTLDFTPTAEDVIFNLAAVHRTPGHPDEAYFETNILGAEHVTAFAERYGIRKILFTSSIAPYGAAEELKTEETIPMPNTPTASASWWRKRSTRSGRQRIRRGSSPSSAPASFTARASTAT